MSNIPQVNEIPPSTADRRAYPRQKMSALAYVDLGPANGGMLLNLGEGGLALATASRLVGEELSGIRFELPDLADRIEVCGRVAWRGESRKEAGIKFLELSPIAAEAIRAWISAQERRNEESAKAAETAVATEALGSFDVTDSALPVREIRVPRAENAPTESPVGAANAVETDPVQQIKPSDSNASAPNTDERRAHPRGTVNTLAYVDLGLGNGGRLLNLSENGLALTAVVKVAGNRLEQLKFELPNFEDWVETHARIIWRSQSKKQVGVQFEEISQEALAKIRKWISTDASIETFAGARAPVSDEVIKRAVLADPAEPVAAGDQAPAQNFVPAELGSTAEAPLTPAIERDFIPTRGAGATRKQAPAVTGTRNVTSFAVMTASVAVISFVTGIVIERRFRERPPEPPKIAALQVQSAAAEKALGPSGASAPPPSVGTESQPANAGEAALVPPPSDKTDASSPFKALSSKTEEASRKPTPSAQAQKAQLSEKRAGNPSKSLSGQVVVAQNKTNSPRKHENPAVPTPAKTVSKDAMGKPSIDVLNGADPTTANIQAGAENASGATARAPTQTIETQPAMRVEEIPAQQSNAPPTDVSHSATTSEPRSIGANSALSEAAPPGSKVLEKVSPAPVISTDSLAAKPSITITMAPFPSLRIPAQSKPDASRLGKSLEMGRLILRVEPEYPIEAASQRIEGTVKIHATIGRDGAIQSIVANGPRPLAEAAKKAVQQWRYKPTLLGGQPIEADQDIVVVFQLNGQRSGSK